MVNERKMERSTKEMHRFLAENVTEGMSIEEINALMNAHIGEINAKVMEQVTEETAKTADDWLNLAEDSLEAGNQQEALRFARKAQKLEPDNIDAEWFIIRQEVKDPDTLLRRIRMALEMGKNSLEKQGFFTEEQIGDFWQIIETRPYMRLKEQFIALLVEFGMLRTAVREAEDVIRLNTQDNLGVRFTLIHLYAMLEEADSAEALLKQFSKHDEGPMLLGLALLYYKLGETEKAEKAARRLTKINKETRAFIRDELADNLERKIKDIKDKGGYRPLSEEELIVAVTENEYVYSHTPFFFNWLSKTLKM